MENIITLFNSINLNQEINKILLKIIDYDFNILAKNYKSDPFTLRGGSMTYTYGGANANMDGTEISEDDFFN